MERSVEITLSAEDMVASQKLQFVRFLTSRRGLVRLGIVSVFASFIFGAVMWNGSGDNTLAIVLFTLFSPLMIIAGPAVLVWFVGPHSARRVFAQQASLRQPYRLTWDEERYRTAGEGGSADIAWRDFYRVERNDKVIALYESQVLRRLVPLRFLSDEQRADLERIVAPLVEK